MMTHIRRALPQDIPQLEKLYQVTRQHTFATRPSTDFKLGDYVRSTEGEDVWVAEENGQILGFTSTYSVDNFIHNLFVHPDHQRQGVGAQLLATAEAALKRPMTLKIAIDNPKACAFYEKHGWYQVSVHKEMAEPYLLYRKD